MVYRACLTCIIIACISARLPDRDGGTRETGRVFHPSPIRAIVQAKNHPYGLQGRGFEL